MARFEPLLFNSKHMNQSKNNLASVNQKPIHITPNPFLVGIFGLSIRLVSLFRKFSISAVYFPPCHSARSRRRSRRIHHPTKNPRPPDQPFSTSDLLSISQSTAWSTMETTYRPCKSAKNSANCVRWRCIDLHANACAASWLKFPEQCPGHQFFDEP